MSKRWKMSRSSSKKQFTRGARRVNPRNGIDSTTYRGGIRF